ncbi:hypothetical protein TSOC_008147 [Tetrabaena socialis]|uniref:Uncharacterized protein n=1 Tax=Tetrabaena socialis TaxID=47790 RepID=A0A2J7ZZ89_9CHLO|nr:hypothetical protein TSOC_008147 [Tetrabaena socialis]|eukprot:PNH05589.1 hypothetical protein TSOC_008147 [Tetrabaena socialis]
MRRSWAHVYHPPSVFRDDELDEQVCVLLERTRGRGAGARFVGGWAWLVVRPGAGGQRAAGEAEAEAEGVEAGLAAAEGAKVGSAEAEEAEAAVAEAAGPSAGSAGGGGSGRGGLQPRLHLGAPHTGFEGPVDLQAVALFRLLPTALSVTVSGKHRRATAADSPCLPGAGYPASDPAHNAADAFNVLSYGLLAAEARRLGGRCGAPGQGGAAAQATGPRRSADEGGGYSAASGGGHPSGGSDGGVGSDEGGGGGDGDGGDGGSGGGPLAVFLQLHGKAVESCPASTVFASGGFGRNATAFYARTDTAVARLAAALGAAGAAAAAGAVAAAGDSSGGRSLAVAAAAVAAQEERAPWAVHTPLGDPTCGLVASRNVFGRVVNGVARAEACSKAADAAAAGGGGAGGGGAAGGRCWGSFVHMEQAAEARRPAARGVWAAARRAALQARGLREPRGQV